MTHKHLVCLICILSCVMALGGVWPAYAQGAQPVQVRVAPAAAQVYVGQTVDVAVEVVDVEALYGADVALTFDPNVVEVVDADLSQDGVQVALGAFLDSGFLVLNRADNTAGTVRFAMTQLNPSLPKSGTGALISIKLRGQVGGRSPLTLTAVELARRDGTTISSTLVSGAVDVTQAAASPNPGPTHTPSATATSVPAQGPVTLPTVMPSATPTSVPAQNPTTMPTSTPLATSTSLAVPGPSVTLTPLPTSTPMRTLPGSTSIPATAAGQASATATSGPASVAVQPASTASPSPSTPAPTAVPAAALTNPPQGPAPTTTPLARLTGVSGADRSSSDLIAPLALISVALVVAFITLVIVIVLVTAWIRRRRIQS